MAPKMLIAMNDDAIKTPLSFAAMTKMLKGKSGADLT